MLAGLAGLLVVLVAVGSFFWEEPEQRYESSAVMMDTDVRIIVYHNDEDKAKSAIDAAFERIAEIEAIASRFNQSSELSELNSKGTIANPSPELVEMLEISIYYWEVTNKTFDVTILPLLDLWSSSSTKAPFHLFSMNQSYSETLDAGSVSEELREVFTNHSYTLSDTPTVTAEPALSKWTIKSGWVSFMVLDDTSAGELKVFTDFFWNVAEARQKEFIDEAKQFVGSDRITIAADSIEIEDGMGITLDGMAKGYAVDQAIQTLKDKGIKRALVDAGGDIATLGTKPGDEDWVVGLRNPEDKSDSVTEFELSGEAIASSGNYERYFNESASVGHIMDPTTGYSVFKVSSSTIITDNCTVADILATAIFVLGPTDGIALVEKLPGTEALLLGHDDPQELFRSSGIGKYEIED